MACLLIDGSLQRWGRVLLRRRSSISKPIVLAVTLALAWAAVGCGQEGDAATASAAISLPPPASTTLAQNGDQLKAEVSTPPEASLPHLERSEALAAIDAAQAAPTILIARDDSIVLPLGSTWEYRVQVARTPEAIGMCVENVGTSAACQALASKREGPLILGYGGAPIPVVDVWSEKPLFRVVAVLLDGQVVTTSAVATEGGWFAALPFSAKNRPVSLAAHTERGEVDLELESFVGDDVEAALDGASY